MSKSDLKIIKKDLLCEKPEIRKKAVATIKSWPAEKSLPLLVEIIERKNDDVFSDLSKVILSYKDKAIPYLVKALTSDNWNTRKSASQVLGKMGDSSLKKLMELIPDNENDVDYWMVQTLSNMGGEATQYLVRVFKHPNESIKLAAIRAACNVKDPRMVNSLLHLLEDKSWPVRKAAYDSLEKIYSLNYEAVVEALHNSSDEARFWIVKLLAQQANPELTATFAQIVDSGPMESKLEAIKALAMIENDAAHRILVSYLAHKSWTIRNTAADAIWAQGLGASNELLNAMRGSNVDARYWSVKLLGQTREPELIEEIIKCLSDSHTSVRVAACTALGAFNDKRALPALMQRLSDESEEVRTAAILAVSQLSEKEDPHLRPVMPKHLRDENTRPCPHCSKRVGINFSFCPFCLGHLKNVCKSCGRPVEATWKGCPDCGAQLI